LGMVGGWGGGWVVTCFTYCSALRDHQGPSYAPTTYGNKNGGGGPQWKMRGGLGVGHTAHRPPSRVGPGRVFPGWVGGNDPLRTAFSPCWSGRAENGSGRMRRWFLPGEKGYMGGLDWGGLCAFGVP